MHFQTFIYTYGYRLFRLFYESMIVLSIMICESHFLPTDQFIVVLFTCWLLGFLWCWAHQSRPVGKRFSQTYKVIDCLFKMRTQNWSFKDPPKKHILVIIVCYLNYVNDSLRVCPRVRTCTHTHTHTQWDKDFWYAVPLNRCTTLYSISLWWILRLSQKCDPFDS